MSRETYEQRRERQGPRYGNGDTPFKGPRTYAIKGVTYVIPEVKMDNADVKRALGVDPKRHWPDEGVPETIVCGHRVKVLPKAPKKGMGRRCVAHCDTCDRWICTGHFGQHLSAHKEDAHV